MDTALLLFSIGLGVGSIYGLGGLIFVIVFNSTRVMNLATGEYVMVGGVLAHFLMIKAELAWFWTVPLIAGAVVVLSIALNMSVVFPLLEKKLGLITIIIATYAGATVISGTAGALTNFEFLRVPSLVGVASIKIGFFPVVPQYGLCFLFTVVVVLAYWLFLTRTRFGWALKASSENPEMCKLLGISTFWMSTVAFTIAGGIGGVAGLLLGPMQGVSAAMGFHITVNAFISAVLGGMGNPYAAVVGGLLLGLVQVFISGYLAPGYAQLASFVLLLLILYIRPQGLFGARGA